ncbi:MAG: 50S ribosomal protein L1 [Puniceicoccales bacterium]|jgi:large subunit ribosomal protein L1|nr:50S ribosomal protein L1 [Puniceicoccales bacterium]
MKRYNKRQAKGHEVTDLQQCFSIENAVGLLEKMPKARFDETVELSMHLGIDPKLSDQMVRGTVRLPHGSGRSVRVVAFTESPEEALAAGAETAGLEDLIKRVQEGWVDFDVAVATTSAMKQVRTVARVLGPRGLMPNPKSGTVADDLVSVIHDVKAGRVEFKMDKTANMAVVVGKRSLVKEYLTDNIKAAIEVVNHARPETFRGRFIRNMTLSATMTPSIRLDQQEYVGIESKGGAQ